MVTKPLKIVNNASPGTADSIGGDDWDSSATFINNMNSSPTYTLYRSGTNVKARNNITGEIDYSGDATNDSVDTINSALNNIVNVGSGPDTSFGGGISIMHGVYKCKNTINVDIDTVTRHGVTITGEGPGTLLDFVSAGALTNGIKLRMSKPEVRNLRIRGNSNLVKLIGVYSNDSGEDRADSGTIDNVLLEGPNGNGEFHTTESYTPIAGQIGIYMNAPSGTGALFYWNIHNCKFISLDYGIHTYGLNCTSVNASECIWHGCTEGWVLENASSSHNLSNSWISGHTDGISGVRLKTGTGIFNMANVWAEVNKTATESALIFIDSGADSSNVNIWNSKNISADNTTWFTVKDNSAGKVCNRQDNYMALGQLLFKYTTSTRMTITVPKLSIDTDKIYLHCAAGDNDIVLRYPNTVTGTKYCSFPALAANATIICDDATDVTLADGKDFALGSSNGTKIGTATTQKLGFFNATPIQQKAANADTSGAILSALETEVNEIKQLLRDYGLLAT